MLSFLAGVTYSSGLISVKIFLTRLWKQLTIPFAAYSALISCYPNNLLIVNAYSIDLLKGEIAPVCSRIPVQWQQFPIIKLAGILWISFWEQVSVMLLLRKGMTHSENSRICEAVTVRLKAMVTFGTLWMPSSWASLVICLPHLTLKSI